MAWACFIDVWRMCGHLYVILLAPAEGITCCWSHWPHCGAGGRPCRCLGQHRTRLPPLSRGCPSLLWAMQRICPHASSHAQLTHTVVPVTGCLVPQELVAMNDLPLPTNLHAPVGL